MIDLGDIFLGNTPARERIFLASVFKGALPHYQRLVLPCAGKFAAVEAAVQAGWATGQIFASDVSLFSTVLAHHLNSQPLADLCIKAPPFGHNGNVTQLDLSDPPAVLFALKLAVLRHRAKSYYDQLLVRDLERRPTDHIARLRQQMDALKARIGGFDYRPRDLFAHLEAALDDPGAIIWINPPGYAKGYEKMYATGDAITWDGPPYEQFIPKTGHPRLQALLKDRLALTLRYKYKELADNELEEAVYGGERSKTRIDYILSNRPQEVEGYVNRALFPKPALAIAPFDAPLLPEGYEISPDSIITFEPVHARHALYYRDLFAHRLGATTSERHYLALVDGCIFGVVGMHLSNIFRGRETIDGKLYAEETYGFTAPSYRYPRLNRLLMMLITTRQFLDFLTCNIYRPDGLATTCLTQFPELKTNRGILKLVSREILKGKRSAGTGLYKLRYVSLAKDMTYQEVLRQWLMKYNPWFLSPSATT